MNPVLEANKRMLAFYSEVSKFVGAVLVALSVIGGLYLIVLPGLLGTSPHDALVAGAGRTLRVALLPSLLALCISQFLRVLYDREYTPGWMLRHAHAILYFLAVWVVVRALFVGVLFSNGMLAHSGDASSRALGWTVTFHILPTLRVLFAEALVLVALAQGYKWVMPIILESRTLA